MIVDKFFIGESSTQKTRKMLEAAKSSGAIVVCKNPLAMRRKADNYGVFGVEFVSYEDMNMDVIDCDKVAIDEIGEFFKRRFGVELDSFTMTVD